MNHGLRSTYNNGCRCEPCRAAQSRYAKRMRFLAETGRPTLVDSAPARSHVALLRAAGLGRQAIAERAGVSRIVVYRLAGSCKERPTLRIRRDTEARILAVDPVSPCDFSNVGTTGTTRRLRALVAIGWTQTELARRIDWDLANLNCIVLARRTAVTVDTARMIAALYDELSMTPGPSLRARRLAERRGWLPPLAWDDEQIDDPDHQPQDVRRTAGRGSGITLEDIEDAREQGYESAQEIGWRLGVSGSLIQKVLSRAGQVAS